VPENVHFTANEALKRGRERKMGSTPALGQSNKGKARPRLTNQTNRKTKTLAQTRGEVGGKPKNLDESSGTGKR